MRAAAAAPRAGHPAASSVPRWAEQAGWGGLSRVGMGTGQLRRVLARAGAVPCGCGGRTVLRLVLNALVALPTGKGHSSCPHDQPAPCLGGICCPGGRGSGLEGRHSVEPGRAAGCQVLQRGAPRLVTTIGITMLSPSTRRMAAQRFFLVLGWAGHAKPSHAVLVHAGPCHAR